MTIFEKKKFKVVFIITDYGGFNNFLGELAVELCRKSIDVSVICSSDKVIKIDDKYNYRTEGVKFFFVDFPRGFNILKHVAISNKIKKVLKEISPSFVFIHFTTGIFTTTFTGRLPYYTAGMFHGLGYPAVDGMFKRWMYKFIEKRCVRLIDDVWVLNQSDKDVLEVEFPGREINLLSTAGLGCNLERFDPDRFSAEMKSDIRESLNISNRDTVITFTGRFVFFKGFGKLVAAILKLTEEDKYKNIKLLLIGGEDPAHGTGLSKEETIKMERCKNIINLGFRSDVEKFLGITDLFVFPSEKEGMPVCIIEALAMGVPVIAANYRGCNDLVFNNLNGILLSENNSKNIALAIRRLIDDQEFYKSLRTNVLRNRYMMDRKNYLNNQMDYIISK